MVRPGGNGRKGWHVRRFPPSRRREAQAHLVGADFPATTLISIESKSLNDASDSPRGACPRCGGRPGINVGGVIPNQPGIARPLKPGIEVSIYGQHLGPETGCTAGAHGWSDVKQLCGTAVRVGGVPAALLYVQEKQINLRVPFNVPTEGIAPFVVTREGQCTLVRRVN
ncbi:MAG: hypothetical protein DMG59_13515 [Acidobacteria bacterium]|nr:MAG: hypothetical protein DMG59_13515 [Acidobacteriota bacterium]